MTCTDATPSRADDLSPLIVRARVIAASTGDEDAWRWLIETYRHVPRRVAHGFRLGSADVADVEQTVWLRLAEHIGGLQRPERVAAWLVTTARHECLHVLRRREVAVGIDADRWHGGPDAQAPDAETVALRNAERRRVAEALLRLSASDRALLTLVSTGELSYAEIARELTRPIGSIGPTRARALRRLRSALEEQWPA